MKAGGQIALGKQIFTGPGAHLILSSPNGLNDFLSTPESRSLQQAYLPPLLTGLGNGIQQKGIQDSDSIVSLIASANQALVQGNEGEARRCLKELAEKLSQINPSSYMEAVATSGARRFATHKDFMDMLGKALSGKESKQDPTLDEERRLCIPPAWMLEDTAVVNKGGHGGFVYGDVSMEGALTMGMTTPLGVMASISKTSQNGPAPKTIILDGHTYTQADIDKKVNDLRKADWKVTDPALDFFRNHLPLLIERGLFTRDHYERIVANLNHPVLDVRSFALYFFTNHLPLLIEKGLFTRDHYKRIVATLSHPDLKIRASALYFFTNHLPLLIEKGLFTRDHCKLIIANLSYPMVRVNDAALEFFSDHLPLLIERDYTSQKEIAVIAFQDPDVLQKFFYLLKGHGFINRDLLVAILQQASDSKNILGILANSPDWLSSPHRWNQLLTLLRYEEKRNILRILLGKLRVFAISPNAEEMTGFVSMMNMMTPKELRLLSQEGGSSWITRAQKMRQVLEDSANHFEASQDPRYLAIQKRLEEEGGKILLLDWSLVGMNQVWKSYRLDSDFKKKRKQFLNFLEQNIKRPFPSLARIYTKRGEQVIEEQFTKRLGEEFKAIYARPAWQRLKTSPLYWLLIKASRFMNPEGIASMRRLIEGLRVENGQLVFPRYEELKGVVSDSFLAEWQKEFAVEPQQLGSLEEEAGKEALKAQVTAQVKGHLQMKEGVNREDVSRAIRDLPERVQRWRDAFEASSELDGTFSNEAKALQDIFEAHYNDIRKHFGDTFANIRIDLRNYRQGMERGVRQARRSERFVVSGDIRQIAKSGSEPVETCQTLEYAWANQEGQPLHRMMHGQFKVTNWEIDGVVYARRLLEVTVDERGKEHLLVERLYTAGGFGRIKEFKEQILEYAKNLGIEESHIHFSDEESAQSAPKPLRTGDLIYRDTFREEGQTLQEAAAVRANNRR